MALVCPYSWSRPGGVQSHVAGLARALRAEGIEVDVLAPADDARGREEVLALGRSLPIPDNGSVQRVALSPAAAARTARLVRDGRYDIVHLHEPMIPFTCFTALLTARDPLVGTFHMHAASARWYRVFAPLCRRALARLQTRIAVSAAARDHVARVCPGDYAIVPNGIDLPTAAREHQGPGRTILFVGRPEPRKGLPVLLEALGRLPPHVRLELVGVGERELSASMNGLRLERGRVGAHGYVSDAERTRRLLSADVLCAPSLGAESFGLVLAEAMATGVPVVASDIAGYRDVVTPERGRLVPPGDAAALAAALEELLEAPELRARLAAAARTWVQPLAWPRVAAQVLDEAEREERQRDRAHGRAGVVEAADHRHPQRVVEPARKRDPGDRGRAAGSDERFRPRPPRRRKQSRPAPRLDSRGDEEAAARSRDEARVGARERRPHTREPAGGERGDGEREADRHSVRNAPTAPGSKEGERGLEGVRHRKPRRRTPRHLPSTSFDRQGSTGSARRPPPERGADRCRARGEAELPLVLRRPDRSRACALPP